MIDRVVGKTPLPANVRKDIIERADGIPLFVEEMTKAALEAGELKAMQVRAAVPSPGLAVPASLHASLMARLDRPGPAKELAKGEPSGRRRVRRRARRSGLTSPRQARTSSTALRSSERPSLARAASSFSQVTGFSR